MLEPKPEPHLNPDPNPLNWTLVTLLCCWLPFSMGDGRWSMGSGCWPPAVNFILQGIIRLRPRDLDFHANWIRNKGARDRRIPAILAATEFEEKLNSPVNMNVSSATFLQMSYDRKKNFASHKKEASQINY